MSVERSCVLLLSGGLDSATLLAAARADGWTVHSISFDYGQKQAIELACAAELAAHYQVASHRVFGVDIGSFGASALTEAAMMVPKDRSRAQIGAGIPSTYVPGRNTVFLSLALALAESRGLRDLFIGVNALDYSGYPDCRPAFIDAFTALANSATRAADGGRPFRVHAPLIAMTKTQIVRLGLDLGVDYGRTRSCYEGGMAAPCGRCDACVLRAEAFAALGERDPAEARS
jgi:7-cyano-7-deazaguanine synthase